MGFDNDSGRGPEARGPAPQGQEATPHQPQTRGLHLVQRDAADRDRAARPSAHLLEEPESEEDPRSPNPEPGEDRRPLTRIFPGGAGGGKAESGRHAALDHFVAHANDPGYSGCLVVSSRQEAARVHLSVLAAVGEDLTHHDGCWRTPIGATFRIVVVRERRDLDQLRGRRFDYSAFLPRPLDELPHEADEILAVLAAVTRPGGLR